MELVCSKAGNLSGVFPLWNIVFHHLTISSASDRSHTSKAICVDYETKYGQVIEENFTWSPHVSVIVILRGSGCCSEHMGGNHLHQYCLLSNLCSITQPPLSYSLKGYL